ncbi:MAG: efflux RND transporter permease subunit [Pseudomonadota bacterium]
MSLTRQCLNNPAAVAVMIAMVLLMGVMAINRLPVQMLPNIERPVMTVSANWRGGSPREVESELIEPIERELRGIPGMRSMVSNSGTGRGRVTMEFALGTDMDETFTEISSRMQRVNGLPVDADPPRISKGRGFGGDTETLIFLFAQMLPDAPPLDIPLGDFIEKRLAPEFETIEGVAGVDVRRNDGQQIVKIEFDPLIAAQLGINVSDIAQRVNRSNDVSGGKIEVGRRDYTLRYEGKFAADNLESTVLAYRNGAPVTLGDVASVAVGPDDADGIVVQNGNLALSIRVEREPGTNTLAAINDLTRMVDRLNTELAPRGIFLEKSFDPSIFINRAIALLSSNLIIGVSLAIGALWLFIRRLRATLLIAAAIPICLMATIAMLDLFGRTLNIISLAGLAFATGMVLDAAIVALENFVRLRENGTPAKDAAATAISQVGGALFASTITTVAIFIPIMFFEDVEGQLFADLALTIAIAVSFSFLVAITVLPVGAAMFIRGGAKSSEKTGTLWDRLADFLMALTAKPVHRLFAVTGLIVAPIALVFIFWPQMNYLPPVKQDKIDVRFSFPSGASIQTLKTDIFEPVISRLDPYLTGEKEPSLRNYYFFANPNWSSLGVRINDQTRVNEMISILRKDVVNGFPDTRVFVNQGSLFNGFGGDASISLELQASDGDALAAAANEAIEIIKTVLPGTSVRPNPDPQVVSPELRLIPDDRRIAEVGMTRANVAQNVRALGDGLFLGEFFTGGERLDMFLRTSAWSEPEYLMTAPVATPAGGIVTLGELTRLERSVGPVSIRRLDSRRTISLGIRPPDGIALGTAVETLRREANPQIYELMPSDGSIKYGGDADALARAIVNLGGNFILAVMLLFLIMAALFKSVKDAALVIITLPMAAVGGILLLRILDLFSPTPLDLLGMIGFIILLGLVVNNAILLVSQTRASEAAGLSRRDAVHEALRLRVRPIFMSTSTSLMGMLPLLLAPGAGSLIYRGLAAVIVGGMAVSTLFTLILLPAMLQLNFGKGAAAGNTPLTEGAPVPAE